MDSQLRKPAMDSVDAVIATGKLLHDLITDTSSGVSCQNIVEENRTLTDFEYAVLLCDGKGLPAAVIRELQLVATSLWKVCDLIKEEKMQAQVRAATFWALNLGFTETTRDHINILIASFIAARSCIGNRMLDSALEILEPSAKRLDILQHPIRLIDQSNLDTNLVEYYMLRIQLEVLKGRSDIADHLFSQAPIGNRLGNRAIVIETCYNTGIYALQSECDNIVIMWLERAVEQVELSIAKDETTSFEIKAWNIRSRATLVRAYLATKRDSKKRHIEEQMAHLKRSSKDELPVQILELEIIRQDEKPDLQRFLEVLNSIMETPYLTKRRLDLATSFARILWDISPESAMKAFLQMLRTIPFEMTEYIGETFLRLVSLSISLAKVSETHQSSCIAAVEKATWNLRSRLDVKLRKEVILAVVMVIWKHIEKEAAESPIPSRPRIVGVWCLLILENELISECLFNRNKLVVLKKYANTALNSSDPAEALKAIDRMSQIPEAEKDEQVHFLRYRQILQGRGDIPQITLCTTKQPPEMIPSRCLLLCALEAQRRSSSKGLMQCLEQIEMINDTSHTRPNQPNERRFSDAYMCPLVILKNQRQKSQDSDWLMMMIDVFVSFFEAIYTHFPEKRLDCLPEEAEWLLSIGINLEISHYKQAFTGTDDIVVIECLLKISLELIQRSLTMYSAPPTYPSYWNSESEQMEKLFLPVLYVMGALQIRMFNLCICNPQMMELKYDRLRFLCWVLCYQLRRFSLMVPGEPARLIQQFAICAFRPAIVMNDWKCVGQLIETFIVYRDPDICKSILELILTYERRIPKYNKLCFISCLIKFLFGKKRNLTVLRHKFPHWLRIYFDLCLSDEIPDGQDAVYLERAESDTTYSEWKDMKLMKTYPCLAEEVLDQALVLLEQEAYNRSPAHQAVHIVADSNTSIETHCTQFKYPVDEIEYLAARSFNQAIDFFAEGNDEDCRRWAQKSIKLAEGMDGEKGSELAEDFRRRLDACFN